MDAASRFLLSQADARGIIDVQLQAVNTHWLNVCNEAGLGEAERNALWGRQFLNPFALQEYSIA